MNESFDDQLDSAIDALLRNAPRADRAGAADAVLIDTVQFVSDLRQQMPVARPSEAAIQRGRVRLLTALDARARTGTPYRIVLTTRLRQVFKLFLAPSRLAWRAAIASSLLMTCLALNGALGASAGSLPGDPLYSLKRMQEQLRLGLTVDGDAREKLQRQIDDTRVGELNAIRRMLRVVRTEITGMVDAVDGNTLIVDHTPFTVDRSLFAALGHINVGDRVTLTVQTNSDGSVIVVDFRREPPTKSSANAVDGKGGTASESETLEATMQPAIVTAATESAEPREKTSPAPTPHPSSSAQASPTPEKLKQLTATPPSALIGTPTPDDLYHTPMPTYKPDITNTPHPTETREPAETSEPTRTRRPTETPGVSKTPRPTATHEATPVKEPTSEPSATQTPTVTGTPDQ